MEKSENIEVRPKTIDEFCNQPSGSFKAYLIDQKVKWVEYNDHLAKRARGIDPGPLSFDLSELGI